MAFDGEAVTLSTWSGPWPQDDPDANFKSDVAAHTLEDPMPTLVRLAESTGIPVGALVRYILVKWASAGSETLLAAGPQVVDRMWEVVREAEQAGTDADRLRAYRTIAEILAWLRLPLDAD
jgi:hypothetical protein